MNYWTKFVPKSKSRYINLKNCTLANLQVLDATLTLIFKYFLSKNIYNLNLKNLVPKLESHQVYLKICTLANLKVLDQNLTGFSFSRNFLSILTSFKLIN